MVFNITVMVFEVCEGFFAQSCFMVTTHVEDMLVYVVHYIPKICAYSFSMYLV